MSSAPLFGMDGGPLRDVAELAPRFRDAHGTPAVRWGSSASVVKTDSTEEGKGLWETELPPVEACRAAVRGPEGSAPCFSSASRGTDARLSAVQWHLHHTASDRKRVSAPTRLHARLGEDSAWELRAWGNRSSAINAIYSIPQHGGIRSV